MIHPSTLELMDQLGLIDRLLAIPHGRIREFVLHTPAGNLPVRTIGDLKSRYPDLLQLPQAKFLELVTSEGVRYPSLHLVMGARVEALLEEDGRVCGVRYRDANGWHELRAQLTVAADGRYSKVRQLAGMEPEATAQPIDCLWFRLPHLPSDARDAGGIYAGKGQTMVLLDRGAEWQVSSWFPKGTYQCLRSEGLEALRQSIAALVPWLADRTGTLQDWKQTAVLAVESSRLPRWYKPGLLLIGDAAHVMSPVGGVGINLAIQDAVATSNIVGPRLSRGTLRTRDLAGVQRRREWPTRLVQTAQRQMMRQILAAGAIHPGESLRMPLAARVIQQIPPLQSLRTRLFAYGGLTPERLPDVSPQEVAVASPGAAG
jgi:2-polyprenyl-6-methoxyphenol hydroxylase-like FAD-dependent oxidoreductase